MFLLNLSDYMLEAMERALDASFESDIIDQFLTIIGMDADYEGESDFGTLTRLDLDAEDRVALTLLSWHEENLRFGYEGTADPKQWAHVEVMLGFGSDYKWWADWQGETVEHADRICAEFSTAYSEWLDENDPDSEPEVEPAPVAGGLLDELRQAERMLATDED